MKAKKRELKKKKRVKSFPMSGRRVFKILDIWAKKASKTKSSMPTYLLVDSTLGRDIDKLTA